MHESTVTLGEVVSILFDHYVEAFGNEEIAAHATAVTVSTWFLRGSGPGSGRCCPLTFDEHEMEA